MILNSILRKSPWRNLLLICLMGMLPVFSSAQTIPDFDFENWNTVRSNIPIGWNTTGLVSRLSPGYQGNFAIRLQGNSAVGQAGSVLYGVRSGTQFTGGIPFTSHPDTVQGFFSYAIAPGDTACLVVILKNSGVVIGSDTLFITGLNTGTYLLKKAKIKYRSAATPDSLIIGLYSTRLNSPIASSFLLADQVLFTNSSQIIPNGDFESWTQRSFTDPISWKTQNKSGVSINSFPISRVTDRFAGYFAAQIQNISQGAYFQPGYALLGRQNGALILPGMPVSVRDTFLVGYYKFAPQNGDTCVMKALMFRNDSLVGTGTFKSAVAATIWTPFVAPITYIPGFTGTPDSAAIQLSAFVWRPIQQPLGASILKVDDISFNTFLTSVQAQKPVAAEISITPNPFSDVARITLHGPGLDQPVTVEVYDMTGKKIRTLLTNAILSQNTDFELKREGLDVGLYCLSVKGLNIHQTLKFLIIL